MTNPLKSKMVGKKSTSESKPQCPATTSMSPVPEWFFMEGFATHALSKPANAQTQTHHLGLVELRRLLHCTGRQPKPWEGRSYHGIQPRKLRITTRSTSDAKDQEVVIPTLGSCHAHVKRNLLQFRLAHKTGGRTASQKHGYRDTFSCPWALLPSRRMIAYRVPVNGHVPWIWFPSNSTSLGERTLSGWPWQNRNPKLAPLTDHDGTLFVPRPPCSQHAFQIEQPRRRSFVVSRLPLILSPSLPTRRMSS